MDEGGTTTKAIIYCRGCDYDLRESALRCPECGKAFDATNPKTYFTSPRSRRVRRWVRRIVLLILLILLPPGMGLGWLWWGWKAEQWHIAALKEAEVEVMGSKPLYPWLPQFLPKRWMFLAARADRVYGGSRRRESANEPLPQGAGRHIAALTCLRQLNFWDMRVTDQDVHQLRGLSRLEMIILTGPGITDQALADLAGMNRMEMLILRDTSVAGPGLRHLAALPRLQLLALEGKSIGDEALAPIGEMRQLQELFLPHARITDDGMKRLAGLKQIRTLDLTATKVGDEGLKCLAGMTKLKRLCLGGVRTSLAAEQRLRTALPQLIIHGEPQRPDPPAPAASHAGSK